ncbi:chaperonin 10-like protein [Vararia minispora EC-137]|uniref:Chaperonin 10-like protein n=1 Tax=Vararia minispora EC-137 TaxID=1314806 RepID=A0ACB8QJ66_9AGAM|nr:chaperonin 10-like protein [Vararia minispora EC-137]
MALPQTHKAVVWRPPARDIRVEQVPIPKIEHPDDAIVKIQLAGLCGSDLHVYRGDEDVHEPHVCGHELIGHVVALGSSFGPNAPRERPALYATLKLGDKVVVPFTISCGECEFCRRGFTARCIKSCLLGQPILPGGQAQYARIPHAGGTLFALETLTNTGPALPDASLLLLADILPTGIFVALQALSHPKLAPALTGTAWPASASPALGAYFNDAVDARAAIVPADKTLQIAVVGLGPVGLCALFALLDMLATLRAHYRVIGVDLNPARRAKAQAMYDIVAKAENMRGEFCVADGDEAKDVVKQWGRGGCHAVLEVVGHPSALSLSLALLGPVGIISSCGVHQAPAIPFTGRELYNANATLEFGRCSVRAVFPAALRLLLKRRDIFGIIGDSGLVERVVGLDDAPEAYEKFNRGEWGKVVFDPWA